MDPRKTSFGSEKGSASPSLAATQIRLILPEATAIGVRLSHASHRADGKPDEAPGARLSNTSSTYLGDGDNLGKLRIIPDRCGRLEGARTQRPKGAPRWDGVLSGSWWCNGPPSLRRVRAMGVGARRWALRQGPRPYGAQQARNLRNGRKPDGGTPSPAGL